MHAPTILIIEDRSWVREILRGHILRRWRSARVVDIDSRDLETRGGAIVRDHDVVVLAQSLDHGDGPAILRDLVVRSPGVPIVSLTDAPGESCARRALSAGAADVLARGQLEAEAVQAVVREALRGRSGDAPPQVRERAVDPGLRMPGDFVVEAEVARGPLSRVYEARSARYPERLALKLLPGLAVADDTAVVDFLREQRRIADLRSERVVRVLEAGRSGDDLYVAMEYLPGGTLRDALGDGALSEERAVAVVRQLCTALDAVHVAGLLHRDVKPANAMLRADGSACLIDFGLARALAAPAEGGDRFFGTPYYISPEQGDGGHVDVRSDLYSLGILFFELLTGRRPFVAARAATIALAHRYAPRPRLPAPLARYQPALNRLLAVVPDERPPTARAVADLLNLCASE